jgi:purine-binding chemotaxis protein CheW
MSDNGSEAQFVTLGIEHEVFGVPVDIVQEILDMRTICRMPDAPAHVAGLIDVRGRAVPVIDLRVRLGLPAIPSTPSTRILVLDVTVRARHLSLGLMADRVFEVTSLDAGSIGPTPDIGTGWRCEYISGIGRRGDGFVIILDLSRLLSTDEVALLVPAPPAESQAA